jgi:hypothetical protein
VWLGRGRDSAVLLTSRRQPTDNAIRDERLKSNHTDQEPDEDALDILGFEAK